MEDENYKLKKDKEKLVKDHENLAKYVEVTVEKELQSKTRLMEVESEMGRLQQELAKYVKPKKK